MKNEDYKDDLNHVSKNVPVQKKFIRFLFRKDDRSFINCTIFKGMLFTISKGFVKHINIHVLILSLLLLLKLRFKTDTRYYGTYLIQNL